MPMYVAPTIPRVLRRAHISLTYISVPHTSQPYSEVHVGRSTAMRMCLWVLKSKENYVKLDTNHLVSACYASG